MNNIQRRKQLDKDLKDFSAQRKPSETRQKSGREKTQQLFKDLEQSRVCSIDRKYIAGSSGKKTAVDDSPDFDLIVFVNNEEPPFGSTVIPRFVSVLDGKRHIKINRTTPSSINLTYDNDYEIDLLPASNYTNNMAQKPTSPELAARQALITLQKNQEDPKNNYYRYSSCLAETTLGFVKQQNSFVHELIRLCKYWNSKITISPGYIAGRSFLIQLIAIKAGHLEQCCRSQRSNNSSLCLIDAFESFLGFMKDFQNLEIEFETFDPLELIRTENNWRPNVSPQFKQKPFVMDPANPFNNLISQTEPQHAQQFKMAAETTLARLVNYDPSVEKIETVFEQPTPSRCAIL